MSEPPDSNVQPPADALLWRVQGLHHEVVCYVVAGANGEVVLCVASDGEDDLLVAESCRRSARQPSARQCFAPAW